MVCSREKIGVGNRALITNSDWPVLNESGSACFHRQDPDCQV